MSIRSLTGALCTLLLAVSFNSHAVPTGPGYPAPGGNDWSPSGSGVGNAGGETWSYSNFDLSQSSALYWGASNSSAFQLALDGNVNSSGETLGFSGVSGNAATWTGASNLDWLHVWGNGSDWHYGTAVDTRLTITSTGALWVDATSVGLDSGLGAVLDITGDYSINILFEALMPTNGSTGTYTGLTWQAALDGFDSLNTSSGHSVITNFSGGFYYEDPIATPEPSILALLGLGLALLGFTSRKKT